MQRAVHLSPIGIAGDLSEPNRGIHALLSCYFPHVGLYGSIRGPRPPFASLGEHYFLGKSIQVASGISIKIWCTLHPVRKPSLLKHLSMPGLGHRTMLCMQNVTNDDGAVLIEGRLEIVMPPTCNFVASGGVLLRDAW